MKINNTWQKAEVTRKDLDLMQKRGIDLRKLGLNYGLFGSESLFPMRYMFRSC